MQLRMAAISGHLEDSAEKMPAHAPLQMSPSAEFGQLLVQIGRRLTRAERETAAAEQAALEAKVDELDRQVQAAVVGGAARLSALRAATQLQAASQQRAANKALHGESAATASLHQPC